MKNIFIVTMMLFTLMHIIDKSKAENVGEILYATVDSAEDTLEGIADYLHKVKKAFK